ncbi:hypothetical protein KAU88_10155 [Candidatus Bathyarchaeota archaeon]|nr:hypothetical protein [Candidatus Bathyarchaeota archaeon]
MVSEKQIRVTLLRKMLRHGFIGAKHTLFTNLPKGFPKSEHHNVLDVAETMRKDGYFISRKKQDGLHVSLNPRILSDVFREVENDQ